MGRLVALKRSARQYACIAEADESTRKRMEGSLHKYHEDHIAGKGMNSVTAILCTNVFLCLKQ